MAIESITAGNTRWIKQRRDEASFLRGEEHASSRRLLGSIADAGRLFIQACVRIPSRLGMASMDLRRHHGIWEVLPDSCVDRGLDLRQGASSMNAMAVSLENDLITDNAVASVIGSTFDAVNGAITTLMCSDCCGSNGNDCDPRDQY